MSKATKEFEEKVDKAMDLINSMYCDYLFEERFNRKQNAIIGRAIEYWENLPEDAVVDDRVYIKMEQILSGEWYEEN